MRISRRATVAVLAFALTSCGVHADSTTVGSPDVGAAPFAVRAAAHRGPATQGQGAVTSAVAAERSIVEPAPANPPLGTLDLARADVILPDVLGAAAASTIDALERAKTADLPQPSWWKGSCNSGISRGAFPLGASYRGVQACGPQPGHSGGRLVRFFPGAWGEYEWQCTELVYRFMYLAYGVVPYNGNGDQVVDNYRPEYGGNLVKVRNGTGELPAPGDVVSFVSQHTAIVTAVTVDGAGNGTIDLLEQNAPNDGHSTLTVTGFRIAKVKNWLHNLG